MVMKVLSVAEKPSVAKEIAKILAGGETNYTRRPGHSQYNQLYEITNCPFKHQQANMIVTSVTGHLMEIDFEGEYKNWQGCKPVDLFEAPIIRYVKKENEKIETTLIEQVKKCQVLLLWLDCDTEGENIAYEVIDVCKKANPRIDIYRARFSALIERDIFRTVNNPDRPNKHFSDAVEARQEIDLRLGAAFTRFQTVRLQHKYEKLQNVLISYGPCQFPTLGFVVDRYLKIESFQPESYWTIQCTYECDDMDEKSGKLNCNFTWSRGHVYDRYVCTVLYDMCLENDGNAIVMNVDSRPTTRHRPIPMNTIELQKRASTFLHISSDHTMNIAESLYQRGILSYPRTETDFFKEGFDLNTLIEEQCSHSQWGSYAKALLGKSNEERNNNNDNSNNNNIFLWPRNGGHDDQAHPPIHPTKKVEPNEFGSDDERKVYDLVTRHFLACCSQDAKGSQTNITIHIPDIHGEVFTATGLMILERNWFDVYTYEKWNGHKVPKFEIGDEFTPKTLIIASGVTCPPLPINESDLISEMDKNGIGTDATIAEHIKTIQKREYVIKDHQGRFTPTKLGLALVEAYNSMGYQLTKPYLRASMEADCHKIARGELRKEDVIRECLRQMKECFITVNREGNKLDAAVSKYFDSFGSVHDSNQYQIIQPNLSKCGRCKNFMDLKVQIPKTNGEGTDYQRRILYCNSCHQSHQVPSKGDFRSHELSCPICSFQVLILQNRETQKEHTICPYCFKNPPGPPDSEEGVTEFRCFGCSKAECILSGRLEGNDVDIAPCSDNKCSGKMRMSKTPKGYLISCNKQGCNKLTWWLPKRSIISATPKRDQTCSRCLQRYGYTISKLELTIDIRIAPRGLSPQTIVCPCCDGIWDELDKTPLSLPLPLLQAQSYNQVQNQMSPVPLKGNMNTSDYGAALLGTHVPIKGNKSMSKISNSNSNSNSNMIENVGPSCRCGQDAKLLTVQKEGPNKGRTFYTCANPRDRESHCGFFCWSDEVSKLSTAALSSYPSSSVVRSNYPTTSSSSLLFTPNCLCNHPASVKTVQKEGPNKGRTFFCCSKPMSMDGHCSFMKFTDDPSITNGSNTSTTFASGYSGRSISRGDEPICSRCQQSGHFARQCPNRL